ncbi:MAG: DUF1830 domain-containing protein [Elainellaceae cyanobacterium]
MAQIIDSVPSSAPGPMLCCYVNATSKMQIARITNVQNWYFERVVFPGQRLIFEAVPTAQLEIHCGMMASAILSDTIPCDRLKIEDEDESSDDNVAEASSDAAATSADDASHGDSHRDAVNPSGVSMSASLYGHKKVVVAAAASS